MTIMLVCCLEMLESVRYVWNCWEKLLAMAKMLFLNDWHEGTGPRPNHNFFCGKGGAGTLAWFYYGNSKGPSQFKMTNILCSSPQLFWGMVSGSCEWYNKQLRKSGKGTNNKKRQLFFLHITNMHFDKEMDFPAAEPKEPSYRIQLNLLW